MQVPGPDSAMSFRNVLELVRALEPFAIAAIGGYVSIKLRGIHTLVNSTASEQRQTIARLEGEKATLTNVIGGLTAQRVAGEAVLSEKNAVAAATLAQIAVRSGGYPAERRETAPVGTEQNPLAVKTVEGKPLEVVPLDGIGAKPKGKDK